MRILRLQFFVCSTYPESLDYGESHASYKLNDSSEIPQISLPFTMDRPPPAYCEDPDDPFQSAPPPDPNLSYTTPPNPANMRLPDTASSDDTWHVLSAAMGVGMTNSWCASTVTPLPQCKILTVHCRPLANSLISGVSGATHVAYNSWEAALTAYTQAYHANVVEILVAGCRSNRSRRNRSNTPQSTPGASRSNPYFVASNAPTPAPPGHAQRPTSAGSSPVPAPRSEVRLRTIQQAIDELGVPMTPTQAGSAQHPIMIGSSPAPASDNDASSIRRGNSAGKMPARQDTAAPQSEAHLQAVSEALDELQSSLLTPLGPTPAHTALADTIRSRLRALEEFLCEFEDRNAISRASSPATPTSENSGIEARLASLEASMHTLLAREAQRPALDRSSTPTAGSSISPSTVATTSVAGSSTGPGTLAGTTAVSASSISSRRPYSVVVIDDDDDDEEEYKFNPFTPAEEQELEELLNAIHENYNANKNN